MYTIGFAVLLIVAAQASVFDQYNFHLDTEGVANYLTARYRRPDFTECDYDEESSLDVLQSLVLQELATQNLTAEIETKSSSSITVQVRNETAKVNVDSKVSGNVSLSRSGNRDGARLGYRVSLSTSSNVETQNGTLAVEQSLKARGELEITVRRSRWGCGKLVLARGRSESIQTKEAGKASEKKTTRAEAKAIIADRRGPKALISGRAIIDKSNTIGNATRSVTIRKQGSQAVEIQKRRGDF